MDHRSQQHYYTHLQQQSHQRHGSTHQHGYGASKLALRLSFIVNIILTIWVIILTSMFWNRPANSLKVRNGEELTFNGGNPNSHSISGSCWCNTGSLNNPTPYCMCTPALAIDLVIVTSTLNDVARNIIEDDDLYVWLVRRKDTNQLATLGGFVMIGESVEDAVIRELNEETGIDLLQKNKSSNRQIQPILFGVYSDPRRDNRRHTTSAVFAIHLDGTEQLKAADDVKDVIKIPIYDIEKYSYFADHMTILLDYRKILFHERNKRKEQQIKDHNNNNQIEPHLRTDNFRISHSDFASDIKRSVCIPLLEQYMNS